MILCRVSRDVTHLHLLRQVVEGNCTCSKLGHHHNRNARIMAVQATVMQEESKQVFPLQHVDMTL